MDVTMLLALGMILTFGLAMIYSTSSYRAYDLYGDQMYFFKRQALYMLLAILAMYIVSRYDYRRLLRLSGSSPEPLRSFCCHHLFFRWWC